MEQKLQKWKEAEDHIGLIVHRTKFKFMTGNTGDNDSFIMNQDTISYTPQYTYLWATISAEDINVQTKTHLQQKQSHIIKF